jgi:Tol biopolymer transport system component
MRKPFIFCLTSLVICSCIYGQSVLKFKEQPFWNGTIDMIPHSLYRGCGLASDGSFILGDRGNLVKLYLPSGNSDFIVKAKDAQQYAWASVISPNLKTIAYSWFNGDYFDLMVINGRMNENAVPRLLIAGQKQSAIPYDWSPDGKWILVGLVDSNSIAKIALVSPQNGTVNILKSVGKQLFNKISFSPDGKYITYDNSSNGKSDIHIMNANGSGDNTLISDSSINTAPYWSPNGKYILYLQQNKEAFDINALPMSHGKVTGRPVLVKKSIDFFSPLGFIKNGSFLYGESSPIQLDVYIAEIDSLTQKLISTPKRISNIFPGYNLNSVLSPNGEEVVYNSGQQSENKVIVVNSIGTGKEYNLGKYSGSIVQWFPDNASLLTTRNGNDGLVKLYRKNIKNGKEDSLFELKSDYANGIASHNPILSPDGKIIYYIQENRNLNVSNVIAYNYKEHMEKKLATFNSPDITSFSVSPDGKYLSMVVLYQGEKGRPSALQILDLQNNDKHELFKTPWGDPTKFFGLGWSPDAHYIYYVRSDTATKSSFLWRISISDGKPEKTGLSMIDMRMPQLHPDGKHILFYGGKGWYIKNYKIKAINESK